MNTIEAAELTGLPERVLIRMRNRENTSLISGPPYVRKMKANGDIVYEYRKAEVQKWLKLRRMLVTAADAAFILGCAREEILKYSGLQSVQINRKDCKGRLIINNGRNIYIWIPKNAV